ncbi:helix-turn-helix transcriptional regulator [Aureisphaera sp. CAU 1614]|uniref:Helix-turn-helix transcriptional regulator n=1 Tax=Halomarinibacterium sedimenti TaxID=2857106 RepID=A0A9X1FS46_9FLAO|nr:helix-turn-helix transcriptional regulator [Halomarinibacterium sedimenti]MBW2939074.1 helix-turn-helix transcriptional regulator [Halomarinibacterium sedimenti]
MDKLMTPTADERIDLILQDQSSSFPNETISIPKKLWLQTLSEISLWLYSFHQKQQLKYKRIVEKLTNESLPQPKIKVQNKVASVSEEIINEILFKIKEFELNKGYLDKDLDLSSLAKTLGTNHSYLSRVINQVKEKSFKNYLNDLRIEYAYVDLQTNPKKRRYTIEAIARDVGFKSAESFSKKFKQRFEMYPSVFLKKLNEGN